MKRRVIEKSTSIILITLFIIVSGYFVLEYIKIEHNEYKKYNDLTRADIVMSLSYNKDKVNQFYAIRQVQSMNSDDKLSKGDIVYDFSKYNLVPVLNYLEKKSEDVLLIESFERVMDFLADYNSATIFMAEKIFVEQKNGEFYILKNDIYTYKIEKDVISREGFNKIYYEYLEKLGEKDIIEHFIKILNENNILKSIYSYNDIRMNVKTNYKNFYINNENEIIKVISEDLNNFVDFLYTDYIFIDKENNDKRILLKPIPTEKMSLNFNFKKGDRIYLSSTKYFSHMFILDINDVWQQLAEKGYPKIYS